MTTNLYGDVLDQPMNGFGVDISTKRLDDLDQAALTYTKQLQNIMPSGVWAADVGCGQGGMSLALGRNGAHVDAYDLLEPEMAALPEFQSCVAFHHGDVFAEVAGVTNFYNLIICQRMLHYYPVEKALQLLRLLRKSMRSSGRLFLSASGMASELSFRYNHFDSPLETRFGYLSPEMQLKHRIEKPVCLYFQLELEELVTHAGFDVSKSWLSDFGNVKLIAKKSKE